MTYEQTCEVISWWVDTVTGGAVSTPPREVWNRSDLWQINADFMAAETWIKLMYEGIWRTPEYVLEVRDTGHVPGDIIWHETRVTPQP